jgi:hypothetical protein
MTEVGVEPIAVAMCNGAEVSQKVSLVSASQPWILS